MEVKGTNDLVLALKGTERDGWTIFQVVAVADTNTDSCPTWYTVVAFRNTPPDK